MTGAVFRGFFVGFNGDFNGILRVNMMMLIVNKVNSFSRDFSASGFAWRRVGSYSLMIGILVVNKKILMVSNGILLVSMMLLVHNGS